MPKKKHKPEEIVAKLRQADVLISQGQDIADVIRQIGVSEVAYYRWCQEYGGLKTEQVKRLTVASVRELGYTVIHADGAKSALEKLDAHPETTMLFTDIVMPDINGQELATEALRRQPDIKVLYTTGFARGAIVHDGQLEAGLHFIAKPFTLAQVAAKMSKVLSGSMAV